MRKVPPPDEQLAEMLALVRAANAAITPDMFAEVARQIRDRCNVESYEGYVFRLRLDNWLADLEEKHACPVCGEQSEGGKVHPGCADKVPPL